MDKKYTIFDMDGTLIDSMSYWKNLMTNYLSSKGILIIPDEIATKSRAMTIPETAELFVDYFKLYVSVEECAAEMNAILDNYYHHDIQLKTGAGEYLERLSKKGTQMCIASATSEPLIEVCLTRLGVLKYFQFQVSCEAVGAGKNKPDVYLDAIKRFNCLPSETAVYEDAIYAIKTAKKAGFYVVGVYDSNSDANWKEIKELSDETILSF